MKTTKRKCVIYARVSTEAQDYTRQVCDLKEVAAKELLEVVKVFTEKVSGAANNEEREAFAKCLEYCKSGNADTILVSEMSRFGRSVAKVLTNVEDCISAGVNVFFQREGLWLFDKDGKQSPLTIMVVSVLASAAQIEKENIRYRMASGYKRWRENQETLGEPIGRHSGTKDSDEKVKEKYRRVITLLKQGQSIRNTATIAKVGVSTVQRVKARFNL